MCKVCTSKKIQICKVCTSRYAKFAHQDMQSLHISIYDVLKESVQENHILSENKFSDAQTLDALPIKKMNKRVKPVIDYQTQIDAELKKFGDDDTFYPADPVLRDLGFTAVMFVITGLSLPGNSDIAVNSFYLNKSELAYMHASGRWKLESHGEADHAGYDVPSASSTAADLRMVESTHFLSNKFWLPEAGRPETTEE